MQLTVGICAFNEGKNIGHLLKNILNEQKMPKDTEVIVVCSGCTDNTVGIVKGYTKLDSRVNIVIENERKGKASAVNRILEIAKGNAILFISADTLPKNNCFARILEKLQGSNVGVSCGNPKPINDSRSLVDRIVHLLWGFHDHVFCDLNDAGLARHATEIFCIKRGIVNNIPNSIVNDDAYIALVAKKKGWLIKYDTLAQVYICGPQNFREYLHQRCRIIYGHYQVKKLTGETPQYIAHLIPQHPMKILKLVLWLPINYDVFTLGVFVFAEILLNIAAIVGITLRKKYTEWEILPSTKKLTLKLEAI